MRKGLGILGLLMVLMGGVSRAQSIHLSQYYNAPILITPANTALMPDYSYRVGLNYRNQWSALPVPFNTFSSWGDFKIGAGRENDRSNWLGVGFTIYQDKAGDGQLKKSQVQGNVAYHLQMSSTSMISVGMSAASVSSSVNYDRLTFDAQWDGLSFNSGLPNGEKQGIQRAGYVTVGAGVNFAFFPNENLYIKIGGGAVNLNKPVYSFYPSGKNVLDMRPSATIDVLMRTGPVLIINPSAYYTTERGASEIVAGSQFRTVLSGTDKNMPIQLILGGFYRIKDAAIGVLGLQVGPVQFTTSYDMTLSSLAPYNSSYGALEFSLIYMGNYGGGKNAIKSAYSCPRFN